MTHDPFDKRFSEYWTSIAGIYDRKVGHGLVSGAQHRAWREVIKSQLPFEAVMILDVGCGTGFLSQLCLELGHRVVSIDYSIGMLCQAQSRLIDGRLCLANAHRLPFSDGQFDRVICRFLLWTLREPHTALTEWRRLLRPGGQLLAIETGWWDHFLQRFLRNGLAGLLNRWHDLQFPERTTPAMEDTYQKAALQLLLFQRCKSRRYLEETLHESGFGKVTFQRLKTIEKIEKEGHSLRRQMEYQSRYLIQADRMEV